MDHGDGCIYDLSDMVFLTTLLTYRHYVVLEYHASCMVIEFPRMHIQWSDFMIYSTSD